ncbi:Lrp/AsnC family transcriptional regulator [uncultured Corynebacterium sp.]|uniref:Lrp/AsnC family transcriptional regulator n=1 Tax=uncultured Corynebacterium sp. TaxID=159447 RepID=UPI0025E6ADED|nr:Lrp/AsnC family transcriptional regulator [uncultured Corynebacterium sp.]
MRDLDRTDIELCMLLNERPKAGVREYARVLGVARATVSSRIDKLVESGVIGSFAPHFDPGALGFPLGAFVHVTLDQRALDQATAAILRIPWITEAHSIAGPYDLSCRVVARDHEHLEQITLKLQEVEGVQRTRTEIILRSRIPARHGQLLQALADLRNL